MVGETQSVKEKDPQRFEYVSESTSHSLNRELRGSLQEAISPALFPESPGFFPVLSDHKRRLFPEQEGEKPPGRREMGMAERSWPMGGEFLSPTF
jgi:hypothetical protein